MSTVRSHSSVRAPEGELPSDRPLASAVSGHRESPLSYPLAPMQQGMLYQASLEESGPRVGYDIEQVHIALDETPGSALAPDSARFDIGAFEEAWTTVARRHSALLSRFVWEHGGAPVQQAVHSARVPVAVEDWSLVGPAKQAARRAEFLRRDRARAFDLRVAPAMRVTLFMAGPVLLELVWTFHHILLDGRSIALVLDDVFQAYRAHAAGEPTSFRHPAPLFVEHVLASRARLDVPAGRRFFREQLRDLTVPTPLPPGEAGEPPTEAQQRELARTLPTSTLLALQQLARDSGCTLASVVHAAWAVLLSRHADEQDVLFGTVCGGRRSAPLDGANELVGLLINTLPLRVRMEGTSRVVDLVRAVHAARRALAPHESLPLSDIHAESSLPGGQPLFESLVNFETRELNATLRQADSGWQGRRCTLHERPALALNLIVIATSEQLSARLIFDPRRFGDAAQERLLTSFCHILAQLADSAERAVGELDALPTPDKQRLLHDFNSTQRAFAEQLIHEPFEARVAQQPTAPALEMEGHSLSYLELEQRANQLAHALQARGAGPGHFVGVCLERGPALVIALLAVVKAGAAYVPLDPQLPDARLQLVLEASACGLVVTQESHRARFTCGALLCDGPDAALLAALPVTRPERSTEPSDVCYVMFTSGSTGKPKGVVLSHRAVMNTLDWVNRTFSVSSADRLLFVTPASFDLSVYDIFGVLGAGGTVVIANDRQLADPAALASLVVDQRITIWNSAPAALQRISSLFEPGPNNHWLRLVLLSGDWIPLALPDAVRGRFPAAEVVSLGGATEAAIWSNWYPVGKVERHWTSIPYGKPIQNARYYVLDGGLRPVPIGTRGDLYIAGTCLAEGYLGQPALTASRFLTATLEGQPPERLYKTGDLARHRADGQLELLGRSDFQVKIRGFRVELGEVEASLMAQPGVTQALCIARADASGHKALIAYVLPAPNAQLDELTLKGALAQRLPDYMVPGRIVSMERFPLTAAGKVDRAALPTPTSRAEAAPRAVPTTGRERQLVTLWEELLSTQPVGLTDDFFALGGHSLLVLTLLSSAKLRLGLDVSLPRFLERPTVAGMLAQAGASARDTGTGPQARDVQHPPLVLLGNGTHFLLYKELARLLSRELPVHLLEAGKHSDVSSRRSCSYASQLQTLCPTGPVALGAFRAAAGEALALAQELQELGRAVPLLVLFDGLPPSATASLSTRQRLRRLFSSHGRAAKVGAVPIRGDLLLVQSGSTQNSVRDAVQGFEEVATGTVTVHAVSGEHMTFLGNAERHQVVETIRQRMSTLTHASGRS